MHGMRNACFALFLLIAFLAFAGNALSANYVLDVNATGDNFEVGTADWNIFFQQNKGGTIYGVWDLNTDSKTDISSGDRTWPQRSSDSWSWTSSSSTWRADVNDTAAILNIDEQLQSRVKVHTYGALTNNALYDLNFNKTTTIYPTIGGIRAAVHMEFTDTNSGATNYGQFSHFVVGKSTGMVGYADNNTGNPAGSDWWHSIQRTDLNSDYDKNSVIASGYAKRAADSSFYNKKWDPDSQYIWTTTGNSGWNDSSGFSPQFQAGEMDYVNYMLYFSNTGELGAVNWGLQALPDENKIDYIMLDYRNPDNLFMSKGTTQGFDYNTAAYLLTADNNKVDFNICTNGIYNDHNNWDTNRYYPAFQINNYLAPTAPAMKINGVLKTAGVDYVSDVNDLGNYAVVVWLGALTGNDENAQFTIAQDLNAPAVTITSPSVGSSTAANSMNVKYWGIDVNSGIKKYYVQMDNLGWIDNNVNITRTFFGLAPGSHTAYVIAQDNADNNSTTATVTFTLTTVSPTIRHLDVNATGANFEVGTSDFNMFFNQYEGGCLSTIVDLNRDSAKKNLSSGSGSTVFDNWQISDGIVTRSESDDNGAALTLNEDLNSRVKITASGALTRWGPAGQSISGTSGQIYDLNYVKTTTIYPVIGGFRAAVHMEFTDTNSAATNSTFMIHRTQTPAGILYTYQDNNATGIFPSGDPSWWHARQRYDLNSDFDANTLLITGYPPQSSQTFWDGRWAPTDFATNWGTEGNVGWIDWDLASEFDAGEMDYLNYLLVLSDTKQFGQVMYPIQSAPDENLVDYYMLDYRNPDNLFMATGTSQGFDYNTGAYKVTASGNRVDFNISTNGIYNDHNNWDTNRYSPAFEIASYTASTRPLMRLNNVDLNEGIDFVADVNTVGQYAVVVWLGSLTADDQNAQLQIDDNFSAPIVSITSPANGSTTTSSSVTITYSAAGSTSGIDKYYVKKDSEDWVDNALNLTYTFGSLSNGAHIFYARAHDVSDENSNDASVAVTVAVLQNSGATGSVPESEEVIPPINRGGGGGTAPEPEIIKAERVLSIETSGSFAAEVGIPIRSLDEGAGAERKRLATGDDLSFKRSLVVEALWGENTIVKHSNSITLTAVNLSGEALHGVEIVEEIPKEVAKSAKTIVSGTPFHVVEEDPIIRFTLGDIPAGGEKSVTYDFNRSAVEGSITPAKFGRMRAPVALVGLDAGDACMGVFCNDYDACTADYCKEGKCVYDVLRDGTLCGAGFRCMGGKCIEAGVQATASAVAGTGEGTDAAGLQQIAVVVAAAIIVLGAAAILAFRRGKERQRK
ncbi:MAG: Ig-like domain-containing protein [Candidatus Diapherotrites archaeon]